MQQNRNKPLPGKIFFLPLSEFCLAGLPANFFSENSGEFGNLLPSKLLLRLNKLLVLSMSSFSFSISLLVTMLLCGRMRPAEDKDCLIMTFGDLTMGDGLDEGKFMFALRPNKNLHRIPI